MSHAIERCALALMMVMPSPLLAQQAEPAAQEPEPEVLIPRGARHGGWGAPVVQISTVRDRTATFVGGRGGWLLDGRLTIGGGGFGLVSRIPAPPEARPAGEDLDLQMGYGGGWLEYTLSPLRLLHLSFGALIGGGSVSLTWHDGGSYGSGSDGFFVAEPVAAAELNLTRFARLDVGVAYRWIVGADMKGLSNSDLAGFSVLAAMKFGKF